MFTTEKLSRGYYDEMNSNTYNSKLLPLTLTEGFGYCAFEDQ